MRAKQAINEVFFAPQAAIWYAFKDEPWFQKILDFVIRILGSFGRVRLARNKMTNEFVAIKMLKKAEILRLK